MKCAPFTAPRHHNPAEEAFVLKVIDFHIHYIRREMLNPTWLDYLAEVNPAYYANIEHFAEDPSVLTEYLDSQGVESAVLLPECAPATSGHVPTEDVIDYCRGEDRLYPFASINPNLHGNPAAQLEVYTDITGLPPGRLLNYFPELEKNADKVIFGSDWPTMPANISDNISAIQSLPLGETAAEAILYKNAKKVLMQ